MQIVIKAGKTRRKLICAADRRALLSQLEDVLAAQDLTREEIDLELEFFARTVDDDEKLLSALERDAADERRRTKEQALALQEQAQRHGLDAWGVLRHSHHSVEQYAEFERLVKQTRWFSRVEHPTLDDYTAGWVVKHAGTKRRLVVSAGDVSFFLRVSGGDFRKLDHLLELELGYAFSRRRLEDFEATSFANLVAAVAGLAWLWPRCRKLAASMTPSALQSLGRAKEALRWALIQKHVDTDAARRPGSTGAKTKPITRQALDWTLARKAASNPALRFSTLPPADQWTHLFGFAPPETLTLTDLAGFKVGVFRALCPVMKLKLTTRGLSDIGNAQPLFNLVRLFGDENAIRRFVKDSGFAWSTTGIHDAGQFTLPRARGWTPAKWAPLCLRAPAAAKYAQDFVRLEQIGRFPDTLATLRRAVTALGYPNLKPEDEPLAEACLAAGLSGEEFRTHREFWSNVKIKTAEFLPQAIVRGEELGLPPKWKFAKLSAADYRGPMLGQLTGCCQHLSGAGRDSAQHGVESPYSGFYVVMHDGKVIAQTWAWLTTDAGLVFDSVESRNRERADLVPVFALLKEGARRILRAPLGIKYVALGDTTSGISKMVGKAFADEGCELTPRKASPVDGGGYYDGLNQVVVAGNPPRRKSKVPEVVGYSRRELIRLDDNFDNIADWQMHIEPVFAALETRRREDEMAEMLGILDPQCF